MQIILLKGVMTDNQKRLYENFMGFKENCLNGKHIKLVRVWDGDGMINCHTYPIIEEETNIVNFVKKCNDVLKTIKRYYRLSSEVVDDWYIDTKTDKLEQCNIYTVKITMIISLYMIMTSSMEECGMRIGLLMNKMKECGFATDRN